MARSRKSLIARATLLLLCGAAVFPVSLRSAPAQSVVVVPKAEEGVTTLPAPKDAPSVEPAADRKAEDVKKADDGDAAKTGAAKDGDGKAKAGKPDPGHADAERLLKAQTDLGLKLILRLAKANDGQPVMISPASLAGALAAIEPAGDKQLRRAIARQLALDGKGTEGALERIRKMAAARGGEGPLLTSDLILVNKSFKPLEEGLKTARDAGIETELFDPEDATLVDRINARVAEKTKGKIGNLLESLPSATGVVALDTLYFKDRWARPFDKSDTVDAPFQLVGGGTVETRMMRADGRFAFRKDKEFVAVELDYQTPGFSLVLVTTADGKPASAEAFAEAGPWLGGQGFRTSPGDVRLPRFSMEANRDLLPKLPGLNDGRLVAFTETPLLIAQVQQRARIDVDEEGTEAAAATAAVATRSLSTDFTRFVADRPFLYALRDKTSGLVLLAGYVAKP